MNMSSESHPFRQFYRNITFDTLKERHDNFSFNKAIDTKQQIHDTIHFRGLLEHPNEPVLVVFKKQGEMNDENITDGAGSVVPTSQQGTRQRISYNNQAQNMKNLNFSENSTRYNEFMKHIGPINSKEMQDTYQSSRPIGN